MRKGVIQKVLAVSISVVMATMSLAGCGGSTSTSASSNGNMENGSYKDYSNGFENTVTIKIPVYDRAYEGWDVTNNYYTQYIQKEFGDKYNINVEYVAIGRTTEVADYMQMIAAQTAPDIIFNYDMPQEVSYYSEGAIQNIDYDELAYYAPTYYENMKDTISTYGQLDGNNAFFFAEREAIYYNWVTLIRKDWIDQVGLSMPTNYEEYIEVLQAWKDAGLGTAGDKLITGNFTYEYGYLPTNLTDTEKATYLDLTVAPFTWEPTQKYLKAMNTEYNAGLLDQEFYLNELDTDAKADFVSGNTGTYGFYISSSTDVISSLLANDPNAEVEVLDPAVTTETGAYYYEYPPYGMIMGINSTTSDEQRAAIWMLLEWMSDPDNLSYLQNGVEGQNYTMVDGVAVPISGYTGESALSKNNNKDYWCLVQEVQHYDTEEKTYKANLRTLAPEGYDYLVEDSYNYYLKNADCGVITPIFKKTVESISENSADLSAMWKEFYVDLVTCDPDEFDSKYEKYCEEYLKGGYQDILDEKAELIEEGAYITK